MDGIDAALVSYENHRLNLEASHSLNYPADLQNRLNSIVLDPKAVDLDELGQLDSLVAECFADSVNALLKHENLSHEAITAIGSHGQNIRHRTDLSPAFSMQIGDPNVIAVRTGIPTIADFRRKDIALGGQGAPLVPGFHQAVFGSDKSDRVVVNIGGISNISFLNKSGSVTGHDCGPGNTLMDQWALRHIQMPFDHSGAWARMGQVQQTLLLQLITDDYFKQAPPKSTGREYFNLSWVEDSLSNFAEIDPVDTQSTLCELSAQCIAKDINAGIQSQDLDIENVYICGGGAHNSYLLERLNTLIPAEVCTTSELGIHPDWVEAIAFAWLAQQTFNQRTGNVPSVTGARRAAILGGLFLP